MFIQGKIRLLLLTLFFLQIASAQNNNTDTSSKYDHPGRYQLQLPTDWKHKHKLIEAITDILPQTIDELKGRDFCTEGKAAYYVRLVIDSVSVSNQQVSPPVEIGSLPHYTFSFNYSFNAALIVADSLNKPVSMLRLMSGEETMTYTRQFTTLPQNAVYRYETVISNTGRILGRRLVQDAPPVNTYNPKMSPFSVLTPDFLLNICEKKVYEIKKMLKKINQE